LDVALEDVLIQNKEEFVRLFLEIGADLKRFLSKHRLLELYERVNVVLIYSSMTKTTTVTGIQYRRQCLASRGLKKVLGGT